MAMTVERKYWSGRSFRRIWHQELGIYGAVTVSVGLSVLEESRLGGKSVITCLHITERLTQQLSNLVLL